MTRAILHFVHANSFPAGTYRVFVNALQTHYDVRALALHAHNPRYPIRDGWEELADELINELVSRYDGPVTLVGHSMGGILSLIAAKRRPELVRGVVLLDAPVVAGWRALVLRFGKASGFFERISPAKFSANRRHIWPDAEAAYQQYASKQLFASWAPDVLRDYIEHGLAPHPEGVTLRFTREAETAAYLSLPHNLGALARRPFPVPVGFIGGVDSAECRQAGMEATRRLVGPHFRMVTGGHLFPMEFPGMAAAAVHELIQNMLPD
jgi:pimeloyl-ACP methyl ester carboxylesterase